MMPRSLKNREKGYTIPKPVRITYFTINGIAAETKIQTRHLRQTDRICQWNEKPGENRIGIREPLKSIGEIE